MAEPNRVRELRLERRMSVAALARAAGVSRQTVYSVESDANHNASVDTMRRFATALGVSLVDLYQSAPVEAVA